MRIDVNNPNDIIRNFVKDLYNEHLNEIFKQSLNFFDVDGDIDDDIDAEYYEYGEDEKEIFDFTTIFNRMANTNYELYKKVIGVIWTDFWLLNNPDLLSDSDENYVTIDYDYSYEEMSKFKSVDDVIDYINEYPELLQSMLLSSLDFISYTNFEKHHKSMYDVKTDKYLERINPLYIFDKILYSQLYEKDDIYCMYLKYLEDFKKEYNFEDYISEYYARSFVRDFIEILRENDRYNYDLLILYMIKDFYIIEKYRELNNSIAKNCQIILKIIETNSFNNLLDKYCVGPILDDIIFSFVEFNEAENKQKMFETVFKAAEPRIKMKLFAKN